MAFVMTLTVATKLRRQFSTVTLIIGSMINPLFVMNPLFITIKTHMAIGAIPLNYFLKAPATTLLVGKVDKESPIRAGFRILIGSFLVLLIMINYFLNCCN